MQYEVNPLSLFQDWIEIIKLDVQNNQFNIENLDDREIAILYLTYLKRSIPVNPRNVLKSSVFVCPEDLRQGLSLLEAKIIAGEDLLPYLSKAMKDISYQDKMLFDWGIHHLHLGETVDSRGLIKRTGPVLYARFDNENAYFIQILGHGNWSNKDLIRIIHEDWPETIANFRINDVVDVAVDYSDEDHYKLRQANINVLMKIAPGAIYIGPGWGVAASGDSAGAVNEYISTNHRLNNLEKNIFDKIEFYLPQDGRPISGPLSFKLIKHDHRYYIHELTNDWYTLINGPS